MAFITADANAAVSAMSHASTRDVPVRAFHPEHLPADADEMHAALVAFYGRNRQRRRVRRGDAGATNDAEASALRLRPRKKKKALAVLSPSRLNPSAASARDGGALESASEGVGTADHDHDRRPRRRRDTPGGESPPERMSPRTHARRVLATLDEALPAAVEAMLREELGDLWAAGVRDDFDPSHSEHLALSADDAFEALRRNLASLAAGVSETFQKRTPKRGPDAGREARARPRARARGRHDEARQLGSVERAAEMRKQSGTCWRGVQTRSRRCARRRRRRRARGRWRGSDGRGSADGAATDAAYTSY